CRENFMLLPGDFFYVTCCKRNNDICYESADCHWEQTEILESGPLRGGDALASLCLDVSIFLYTIDSSILCPKAFQNDSLC
ncbi:hypothetical protein ACJX0J_018736, partial [Zea mays]